MATTTTRKPQPTVTKKAVWLDASGNEITKGAHVTHRAEGWGGTVAYRHQAGRMCGVSPHGNGAESLKPGRTHVSVLSADLIVVTDTPKPARNPRARKAATGRS